MSYYKKELNELVNIVVREGASDLHLSAGRTPFIRVSGFLVPLGKSAVLSGADTLGLLAEMVGDEQIKKFRDRLELDFSYSHDGARFRGNAFFQQGNVGIALRFIPKVIKTISELGLPQSLEKFAELEQGFFLVVGPVGHGKTTTLASLVDIINERRAEHIVTIEDPIEYIHQPKKSLIDQREVRIDTADFHTALVAAFREDADVLMIGEMRDPETISAAVTAAETGHLVFSTLHTNNAAQTI